MNDTSSLRDIGLPALPTAADVDDVLAQSDFLVGRYPVLTSAFGELRHARIGNDAFAIQKAWDRLLEVQVDKSLAKGFWGDLSPEFGVSCTCRITGAGGTRSGNAECEII